MSHKSFSEIQHERIAVDLATRRLASTPIAQAVAIAKHYLAHQMLATHLSRMLEHRQYDDHQENLDELIAFTVEEIKRGHLHDLGIRLEWEKPQ